MEPGRDTAEAHAARLSEPPLLDLHDDGPHGLGLGPALPGDDGDDAWRRRGASDGAIPSEGSPPLSRNDRSRLRRDIRKDEEFHTLFPGIPPTELLLYDYSCALQKDILLHGRLFVTERAIYFRSNILGWETTVILPFVDITTITKERTALFIPNAIQIASKEARFTFSSFIARDQTYANIWRVWRMARQEQAFAADGMPVDMNLSDDGGMDAPPSGVGNSPVHADDVIPPDENVEGTSEVARRGPSARRFTSPAIPAVAHANPTVANGATTAAAPSLSRGNTADLLSTLPTPAGESPPTPPGPGGSPVVVEQPPANLSPQQPSSAPSVGDVPPADLGDVSCGCQQHFAKDMLDHVFDTTPSTLFGLLFSDSQFFRDFSAARGNNILTAGVWAEGRRDLTYTTPVKAKMGPPVAECVEKQRYVVPPSPSRYVIETEVLTPNVPYGDTFANMSRYCITAAGSGKTRLRMSCEVKFLKTGWSVNLAKGFIESNCYDGLKEYAGELRNSVARYVAEKGTTAPVSLPAEIKRPSVQRPIALPSKPKSPQLGRLVTPATALLLTLALLLLAANMFLFVRLHEVEARFASWQAELNGEIAVVLGDNIPQNGDGWIARLQQLQHAHAKERMHWMHTVERLKGGLGAALDVLQTSAAEMGND